MQTLCEACGKQFVTNILSRIKNKCFYCEKKCCENCISESEWREYTCETCIKLVPLRKQFEIYFKEQNNVNELIEKHKFLNHNNERVLKFISIESIDDLTPALKFECKCRVTEIKNFSIVRRTFLENPFNFTNKSLDKMDLFISDYNNENIIVLHEKKCNGDLKSLNKFKWIRTYENYSSKMVLYQLWKCDVCKLEFVFEYADNKMERTYK